MVLVIKVVVLFVNSVTITRLYHLIRSLIEVPVLLLTRQDSAVEKVLGLRRLMECVVVTNACVPYVVMTLVGEV